MKRYLKNESGFALVACILVSFLLLAAVIEYTRWNHGNARFGTHLISSQRARENAETGIHVALDWLRKAQSSQLTAGVPLTMSSLNEGSTYQMTLVRSVSDSSLIDCWSTGYYEIPANGSNSGITSTAIYAQIKLRPINTWLAATPGTLEIAAGSMLSTGTVYGRDLVFDRGGAWPTQVKTAYYFNSVTPANPESFVNFTGGVPPIRMALEPVFPTVSALEADYATMAGIDVLPDGYTVFGNEAPASNAYKTFFCMGDLKVGTSTSTYSATTPRLYYVKGNVTIQNNVNVPAGNGTAFMAVGDIQISSTTVSPVRIKAQLLSDGSIEALGPPRNAAFVFKGSIVFRNQLSIGNILVRERSYEYFAPEASLPFPFITQLVSYKVLTGKYRE